MLTQPSAVIATEAAVSLRWPPALVAAVLAAHFLPLLVLLTPQVSWSGRGLVIILVLISAFRAHRSWLLTHKVSLILSPELLLWQDGTQLVNAVVVRSWVRLGPLLMLRLEWLDGSSLGYCPVLRNRAGQDGWRRLNKRLRWREELPEA